MEILLNIYRYGLLAALAAPMVNFLIIMGNHKIFSKYRIFRIEPYSGYGELEEIAKMALWIVLWPLLTIIITIMLIWYKIFKK